MSLDVNGYNAQFKNFIDFANHEIATKGSKGKTSIAQLSGTTDLGDRTIKANNDDKVGRWGTRPHDIQEANNMARTLFKNAIAEMFGGENHIPKKVLDAMNLTDYDKGKPLTARRILAVKTAIDQEGSAKLRVFKLADSKTYAMETGWKESELPKLARAAHFLCEATGMNEIDAITELSTPGSNANRLMGYGGRFLESAANFKNGLRLITAFAEWHKDIRETMQPVYEQSSADRNYAPADTYSKLNFDSTFVKEENRLGLEKFAFEELSINPKANLAETNMEKLFGMKNNQAINFFGRAFGESVTSTLANIPKEKRSIIYTAMNAFTEPAKNAQQAHEKNKGDGSQTWLGINERGMLIGRLLKNFERAEEMFNTGKLTAKNIINEFFAEIPDKGDYNYKTLKTYFDDIGHQLRLDEDEGGTFTDVSEIAELTMQNTGLPFEECVQRLRDGTLPPPPKYLCTGSVPLSKIDGTTSVGIDAIKGDLYRPAGYNFRDSPKKQLVDTSTDRWGFGFNFPNEEKFYTNGKPQCKKNVALVGEKVIAMCGAVHIDQANSVLLMLSQTGLANLRGGIPSLNVASNEHSVVDFTLSKNEQNGDITIQYKSPAELPFKFSWSTTVDVNGNISSTPMKIEQ
ncbi:MAG: hypothetical protein IJT59_01920 [Desulfovibrionaceae bacterium]|nr:hypothetical protein [Desulfovibrionaceae bacterium]